MRWRKSLEIVAESRTVFYFPPRFRRCVVFYIWAMSCAACFRVALRNKLYAGAYELEHAIPLYFCHGVFIDRFIFRSNSSGIRLPWECDDQSQETNWRHCVTRAELPLFRKKKVILKIDQSVKIGVACSNWSAPVVRQIARRKSAIIFIIGIIMTLYKELYF